VLFGVPWHDRVVIGTTDTPVSDAPLEPRPLEEELDFLLSHARLYLSKDPEPSDVLSIFAGLRPLERSDNVLTTAAITRTHTLSSGPSGLVTITGGKWTTYRFMAEETVDRAVEIGGLAKAPCVTKTMRLHGHQEPMEPLPFGVYGSDTMALKRLLAEQPGWDQPLHPNLPYLAGEVVWAARREMARTVEDVLARRTRALLLDARASEAMAPGVAELLAAELGHDHAWQQAQVQEYRALAQRYQLH
jgi:glycerol-3-phosphate dehydrogenase